MHPLSRAERLTHLSLLLLSFCTLAIVAGAFVLTGSLNAIAITAIAIAVACVPLGLTVVTTLLQPEADRSLAQAERTLRTEANASPKQAPLRRAA